jgi:hypothetical protein
MNKWKSIRASIETKNELKLLSVISGLSVAEIIRKFSHSITELCMKNQEQVFGYDLQFKLQLENNSMQVKLTPKGFGDSHV